MLDSDLIKFNLDKCKFLTWDLETESLNTCLARPWQLGFQVYHGTKLVEEKEVYIKWSDLNVSKGAAEATRFDKNKVELYGREPKEVLDRFNKYLYNPEYKILGHNILGYDSLIHNIWMNDLGYKTDYSYIDRIYDTLPLSRAYKANFKIPEDKKDFLAFQYRLLAYHPKGLKATNSVMAKEFGFDVVEDKLHNSAVYDATLTSFTFFNLIKKLDIQ